MAAAREPMSVDLVPVTESGLGHTPSLLHLGDEPTDVEQIIAVEALDRAGRPDRATEVARRYLTAQLDGFEATGQLWEKLNTVTGDTALPTERYPVPPFHGWSSASAVLLGQRLFTEFP